MDDSSVRAVETSLTTDSTAMEIRAEILSSCGVDIMLEDGTLKYTYDILMEISEDWNRFSNQTQEALLEILAGKGNTSGKAGLSEWFREKCNETEVCDIALSDVQMGQLRELLQQGDNVDEGRNRDDGGLTGGIPLS